MYIRADPCIKLEAGNAVTAPKLRSGRLRTSDKLIAFLTSRSFMRRGRGLSSRRVRITIFTTLNLEPPPWLYAPFGVVAYSAIDLRRFPGPEWQGSINSLPPGVHSFPEGKSRPHSPRPSGSRRGSEGSRSQMPTLYPNGYLDQEKDHCAPGSRGRLSAKCKPSRRSPTRPAF